MNHIKKCDTITCMRNSNPLLIRYYRFIYLLFHIISGLIQSVVYPHVNQLTQRSMMQYWAKKFLNHGPALEIGTFGAKSTLYIAAGSSTHNQLVFTIDHHSGSEEHQLGQEYFDPEIYDEKLGRVNTVPLMQSNLQQFDES